MKQTKSDSSGLERKFNEDRSRIESEMSRILPAENDQPGILHRAIRYSTLDGGKRFRGILCIWTHMICGDNHPRAALRAACAIEFLHAYTLIHDDLPSLDNDDIRRGKKSCHVKFSPAIAILAGDALQALAFKTLSSIEGIPAEAVIAAVSTLAEAAGSRHLVGGQVADIQFEGTRATEEKVRYIHSNKTAALISASMKLGALLSAGPGEICERMGRAGMKAGLAFQIIDDLLDIEGSEKIVGKGLRKDSAMGKITYPAVYGVEKSRSEAASLIEQALEDAGEEGSEGPISYIFGLIVNRIK